MRECVQVSGCCVALCFLVLQENKKCSVAEELGREWKREWDNEADGYSNHTRAGEGRGLLAAFCMVGHRQKMEREREGEAEREGGRGGGRGGRGCGVGGEGMSRGGGGKGDLLVVFCIVNTHPGADTQERVHTCRRVCVRARVRGVGRQRG